MSASSNAIAQLFPTQVRPKRHTYRQDISGSVELFVDERRCEILNISETGVALQSEHEFDTDQGKEIRLIFLKATQLALRGRIAWKRVENERFIYGFEFSSGYLPEGFLEAFDQVQVLRDEVFKKQNDYMRVGDEFKLLTYEIHNFLKAAKAHLEGLEAQILIKSEAARACYRDVVVSQAEPEFVEKLKEFSKHLDRIYAPIQDKELRRLHLEFFRNLLGAYYTQNPFIGRALAKPRGYAGDYEMMNQIYRDKSEGKTFFEMLMHRYGITESSSQSVKYRKGYLIDKIKAESQSRDRFVVGSLACGPAREIVDLLGQISVEESKKLVIVLMDQDVEALLNAKRNVGEMIIKRGLRCEAHFAPLSVKAVLEGADEARILDQFNFNMLYSAGLYDYLHQPVAQMLTQILARNVRNGLVIIGNFHPDNPTKTISELVAEWRLIHRSEADMLDLIPDALVKSKEVHKDSLGIDLFLEIRT